MDEFEKRKRETERRWKEDCLRDGFTKDNLPPIGHKSIDCDPDHYCWCSRTDLNYLERSNI